MESSDPFRFFYGGMRGGDEKKPVEKKPIESGGTKINRGRNPTN